MKVGTKSLLFGVHQFLRHPLTVLLAWIELYGIPNWKEFACIVIRDSDVDFPEMHAIFYWYRTQGYRMLAQQAIHSGMAGDFNGT